MNLISDKFNIETLIYIYEGYLDIINPFKPNNPIQVFHEIRTFKIWFGYEDLHRDGKSDCVVFGLN